MTTTRPNPTLPGEGVSAVKLAFERQLRWLARPQADSDYGIDMHAEVVEDSKPIGRLIGVQIKAGATYFREANTRGWVFRDMKHLEYWTRYSLPVIVVLYDPRTQVSYWQSVDSTTIEKAGKNWKLTVPKSQVLDASAKDTLYRLATAGDPSASRLAVLRADAELIRAAANGLRILIDVEQWVNKLSGRGTIRVSVEDPHASRDVRSSEILAPGLSYKELLPAMFPWARLEPDLETYDDADHEQWDIETGAWDSEEDRYILHSVDFDDWAAGSIPDGLRPYSEDGEVARWRLVASLGPVGRAFLDIDQYLSSGARHEAIGR